MVDLFIFLSKVSLIWKLAAARSVVNLLENPFSSKVHLFPPLAQMCGIPELKVEQHMWWDPEMGKSLGLGTWDTMEGGAASQS